jgi:hypothetical protein
MPTSCSKNNQRMQQIILQNQKSQIHIGGNKILEV